MNNLEFALEMKNKRLASGLSQGELASLTHVSRYSINRFENGKANASKETQNIILRCLNYYICDKPFYLLVDYLSVRFPTTDALEIIRKVLGMKADYFIHYDYGYYGYKEHYAYGEIKVMASDDEHMGVFLELKGAGSRNMEYVLQAQNRDWYSFLAVVLQDKSIKAVLVTKNHDDEKFFNRAMDVVKNIMKKQSTDVDVVSGATYSSNGLINAVKNALKEAEKVTNGQTTEPDKEEADTSELEKAMKEAEELKQEDYTEATYAVLKTRMEDAQKLLDADKTEISQEDVDQALENLNQALALLEKKDDGEDDTTVYKNGIYEGRALCRPDEDEDFAAYNLTLKVTVRDDKIVAVTDVKGDGDSSNDRYILRAANGTSNKKGVTSQLIEKGNTEGIDAVSGATCTSKAILDACENALLSAKRQ